MKTLNEVIKAFSEANKEIGCGDCQFNDAESDDIPCEMTDCFFNDALHYLKEYQRYQNTPSRNGHMALVDYFEESQKNDPLTWEQLKSMVGKPVWIDSVPLVRRWVIIKKFHPIGGNKNLFDMEVEDGAHFLRKNMRRDDGAWWQAYRKERK